MVDVIIPDVVKESGEQEEMGTRVKPKEVPIIYPFGK